MFPLTMLGGFPFLHTLSSIVICRLFCDGRSDWHIVIPRGSFDLNFSSA